MEYRDLERDFIDRTLKIIDQYEEYVMPRVPDPEQFEVTLLINCLFGLLVLPKEKNLLDKLPREPIKQLDGWGLEADHIILPGIYTNRKRKDTPRSIDKLTLKEIIKDMRDSTAHFLIRVHGQEKSHIIEITHLEFHTDRTKFKARIPVDCLRTFVTRLAESVQKTIPA